MLLLELLWVQGYMRVKDQLENTENVHFTRICVCRQRLVSSMRDQTQLSSSPLNPQYVEWCLVYKYLLKESENE